MTIAQRLERNSMPEPNSGCRLWLGAVGESGHGRMKIDGKWDGAHRVAWKEENGPIPDGLWVLHKCDVSCCINTGHHFLGTHIDNMADMVAKGRKVVRGRKGEAAPQAKLTDAQVLAIVADKRSGRTMAADYPVSRQTIDRIKNGMLWPHITGIKRATPTPPQRRSHDQD